MEAPLIRNALFIWYGYTQVRLMLQQFHLLPQ